MYSSLTTGVVISGCYFYVEDVSAGSLELMDGVTLMTIAPNSWWYHYSLSQSPSMKIKLPFWVREDVCRLSTKTEHWLSIVDASLSTETMGWLAVFRTFARKLRIGLCIVIVSPALRNPFIFLSLGPRCACNSSLHINK